MTWPSCAEKQARFKQAKEEADKEIAEFRAQMEADLQMKLLKVEDFKGLLKKIWYYLHVTVIWICLVSKFLK